MSTACYTEDQWLRFLDRETDGALYGEMDAHLAVCDACRKTLVDVADLVGISASAVEEAYGGRASGADGARAVDGRDLRDSGRGAAATVVGSAREAGRTAAAGSARQASGKGATGGGHRPAFPGRQRRARRPAMAWGYASAAAVVVIGVFAVTPARGVLAAFLQTFRVQNLQAVQLTQNDLSRLKEVLTQKGKLSISQLGSFDTVKSSRGTAGLSVAQAAVASGLPNLWPTSIPFSAGAGNTASAMSPGETVIRLNVSNINASIQAYGGTVLFPESVNGVPIQVQVPASFSASSYVGPNGPTSGAASGAASSATSGAKSGAASGATSGTASGATAGSTSGVSYNLVELRAPVVTVQGGVNMTQIKNAILALPMMPSALKEAIAGASNWRDTLFLPTVSGQTQSMTFHGMPAVLGTNVTQPNSYTLIWLNHGVICSWTASYYNSMTGHTAAAFVAQTKGLFP
ncbi:MAG: zf-HC2 domain-containing protein [Bacilli bacterium]